MQGIKPVLSNTRSPAKLGGCSQARTSLLSQATSDGTRGMASGCARGALGWTLGKNYSQKRLFSLGTACPGHWWVTPLECGHGTSCHGLVVVARGWWLDLMILKVFCDMNDSVMLWSAARTLQWKLSHQLAQLKHKTKFLPPGVLLATSHELSWNDLHTSAWNPNKPGWLLTLPGTSQLSCVWH